MQSSHFRYELALIAIFCIVGIFLFPIPVGPYSAVHGPATELRNVHAAMKLVWVMALVALALWAFVLEIASRILGEYIAPLAEVSGPPGCASILRC